jgi:hypothetical protein
MDKGQSQRGKPERRNSDHQHLITPPKRRAARRAYAKVALHADDNQLRQRRNDLAQLGPSKGVVLVLIDHRLVLARLKDELPPRRAAFVRIARIAVVADVDDERRWVRGSGFVDDAKHVRAHRSGGRDADGWVL